VPTVLITGTSRGIGLGLSQECLQRGWDVVATTRNPGSATALAALAQRYGNRLRVVGLDLADDGQIEACGEYLAEQSLDFVISNAVADGRSLEFPAITYESWERAFRVNAYATLKLVQVLVEQVARSQRKTIVAISSRMASTAEPPDGSGYTYRASKAALNMVVRNLAAGLAKRDVIVACVHPGWVRTALGGPSAPLSPRESARAIVAVIDALGPGDSGQFFDHRGERIPW
jgi:NAD(P)-dependent dehydrogenase (short-subunit alcohol dehydrogenase family)